MNWSFGASPLVVTIALIIFIGAAYISFLNWRRSGRRRNVAWLEMLRLVVIALLGFTLLRPEVVQIVKSKNQPEIAVLVDRSGSMATRDVQNAKALQTRTEWINSQLTNKFWQPLQSKTKVVVEEFGASTATNSPAAQTNDSRTVSTPLATDLNAALE